MKIISWNINWIRAVIQKWFFNFIKEENPDIICLQETKAFETQIPNELRFHLSDYNFLRHKWTRPGYAWTTIFFKKEIEIKGKKSEFSFHEFHDEWRVTEISFLLWNDLIHLINVYFPNWWTRADWSEMLSYKLDFYEKMRGYIQNIRNNWEEAIICWDFNICHREIDIARPKENENSIWFLPIERAEMDKLENDWLIDVFRKLNPKTKDKYTWRSYRWWARERNVWRRLDYFWVTPKILDKIINMYHLENIAWSDHCPISLILW